MKQQIIGNKKLAMPYVRVATKIMLRDTTFMSPSQTNTRNFKKKQQNAANILNLESISILNRYH